MTEMDVSGRAEIVPGDVPGGPSTSQTIMVSSLARLLELLPADASTAAYRAGYRDERFATAGEMRAALAVIRSGGR